MNTGESFRYFYKPGRRVEILCAWYLRFHGYLNAPHFILQRPNGTQYTDADILGVRFPYSKEDVVTGGPDPALGIRNDLIDCVIGECSAGDAKLNEPWQENFQRNLMYVLRWIGIWRDEELESIYEGVEHSGRFAYEWERDSQRYRVRFLFFSNGAIPTRLMNADNINLFGILNYLSRRFRCFSTAEQIILSRQSQWDPFIKDVYARLMSEEERKAVGNDRVWIRKILADFLR